MCSVKTFNGHEVALHGAERETVSPKRKAGNGPVPGLSMNWKVGRGVLTPPWSLDVLIAGPSSFVGNFVGNFVDPKIGLPFRIC